MLTCHAMVFEASQLQGANELLKREPLVATCTFVNEFWFRKRTWGDVLKDESVSQDSSRMSGIPYWLAQCIQLQDQKTQVPLDLMQEQLVYRLKNATAEERRFYRNAFSMEVDYFATVTPLPIWMVARLVKMCEGENKG